MHKKLLFVHKNVSARTDHLLRFTFLSDMKPLVPISGLSQAECLAKFQLLFCATCWFFHLFKLRWEWVHSP